AKPACAGSPRGEAQPYPSRTGEPMGARVIETPEQAGREWLEEVLRRAGALERGGVREVRLQPGEGAWSRNATLAVEYAAASGGRLPASLFLKLPPAAGNPFGRSEVDYYTRDYVDLPAAPLPRCYDAEFEPRTGRYHLLLEDLSRTHRDNWSTEPDLEHGGAVAEALAALHAHWWGADRLRSGGFRPAGDEEIDRYVGQARPGLLPLLAVMGGELSSDDRDLLVRVFEEHPVKMRRRAADPRAVALLHTDANPGNILSPAAPSGPTYLIDRQPFDWSLTTWLGVSDLAYVMVPWWPPALRRELEWPVLRRYHQALLRRGIRGYSWERLAADYRLCAAQSLYIPAEWCVLEDRSRMRWVWEPQLRRALAAYRELECDAV
ncbi:MAG TPA: hypothetical protein VFU47_09145, partial [Armatimonadota bacterium]|nr:hypothetical protein [Armatimonadota bacterium]